MTPLSERRYKIQFTADQATCDRLREAQQLLGGGVDSGDLAQVFDRALELLVKKLRKKKFAETDRPRKPAPLPASAGGIPAPDATARQEPAAGRRGRYIPAAIRRAVAQRDGHQCTYVDSQTGRRCASRSDLQYHHEQPWAEGGRHELENVTMRCRAHNLHAARQDFGEEFIARRIAEARGQAAMDRAEDHLPRGREAPDSGGRACEVECAYSEDGIKGVCK